MIDLVRLASRRARGLVWLAIGLGLVSGATNAGLIALAQQGISTASPPRALAIAFAAMAAAVLFSRTTSLAVMIRLPPQALHDLRMQLSAQVMATPLSVLEKIGPAALQTMLTQDVSTVISGILVFPPMSIALAALVACLCYLAFLSWSMCCWVLCVIVATFLARTALDARAGQRFMRAMELQAFLYGDLNGQVAGAKQLLLSESMRTAVSSSIVDHSRIYTAAQTTAMDSLLSGNIALDAGFHILLGTIVFLSPLLLGHAPLAIRTGGALACLFLYGQLQLFNALLPALRHGVAGLRRIESMRLGMRAATSAGTEPSRKVLGRVELVGVTHRYPAEDVSDAFQLGPVDLEFRAGELSFIVGGNGSGKSTLAKLLTGLYDPDVGEIRVDGVRLDPDGRRAYRELFSTVFADFHLFDVLPAGSDLVRAKEHLVSLQLDAKVDIVAGRFTTTKLSQGQRKRLALLVAYLEDRPVYVFDEWAADQDPVFREVFYTSILPELKARGKVVVVITHDDRYFPLADRLVKLELGKVISTHDAVSAVHAGGAA